MAALSSGAKVGIGLGVGALLLALLRKPIATVATAGAHFVAEQLDAQLQVFLEGVTKLPKVPTTAYKLLPPGPPEIGPLRKNTSLVGLDPVFGPKVEPLLADVNAILKPLGMSAKLGETVRTWARQAYLYGCGRAYQLPGRTGTITDLVFATGNHPKGKAVDFDYYVGSAYAGATHENTEKIRAALAPHAKRLESKHGVKWGGHWTKKDIPHWEAA